MEETGGIGPTTATTTGAATAPRLPAFGHSPFSGTFRMKLPANGRVVLPASLRRAFTDLGKVRPIDGRWLNLWTPLAFDLTVAKAIESAGPGMVSPRTRKRMYSTAADVSIDSQGRFVLAKELRDAVGIDADDDIVLAGAIEAIEIWSAARYAEEEEPTLTDADLFFGNFGGLDA
jgi:DNA-binding transcriptional regulator/RsmH inhibitor MraZ